MQVCCYCCEVASVMSNSVRPHRQQPTRLPCSWDSPGKNTGVRCHFLLQYAGQEASIKTEHGATDCFQVGKRLCQGCILSCLFNLHAQFSSVQSSPSVMSYSLWPHELQHARPPYPSPTPGVHSDSRPSSQWCHPAISSSVVSLSSCP